MIQNPIKIRPAAPEDREQLMRVFQYLNTPHASPSRVDEIISSTVQTLDGTGPASAITLVAEDAMDGTLKGAGSVIKLSSGDSTPLLYTQQPDGSFQLGRYPHSAVEFGGMVVPPGLREAGIGKAITAIRALVADNCKDLFGITHIIADFLPPLDDPATKENIFWKDLILKLLDKSGNLERIKRDCAQLLRISIKTNTELSAAIGNLLPDDDRNHLVLQYFPERIESADISDPVRDITEHVRPSTRRAVDNLRAVYGEGFVRIGAFPINGGPNYHSKVEGHTLTGVALDVGIQSSEQGTDRGLIQPIGSGETLAYYLTTATPSEEGKLGLHVDVANAIGVDSGMKVQYYSLPKYVNGV